MQHAGLNLEMPPSYTDDQIVYAARDGRIAPAQLDRMAQGMIDLINKARAAMSIDGYRFDVDAAETVQVYVAPGKADVARPKHELKGFTKVFLKAGESKSVTIDLDERAFAYWSEKYNDWHVESGEYAIEVGVSSRDIADTVVVTLEGDGKSQPLTEWSTYGEWETDPFGAKIVAAVAAAGEAGELTKLPDNAMMRIFLNSMPINSLSTLLGEGGKKIAKFMVDEYAKLAK